MDNSKKLLNLFVIVVACLVIGPVRYVHSQMTDDDGLLVHSGYVFPHKVMVAVGEDIVLKLVDGLADQTSCAYRKSRSKIDVDVHDAVGNVERLAIEDCGIRIKNVTRDDVGFWRLTSQAENGLKRGMSYIELIETSKSFQPLPTYTPLEKFTPEDIRYCSVFREDPPTSSISLRYDEFPKYGECQIPNINLDPQSNGLWNVKIGVKGVTDEINFVVNVNSKSQKLVTGIETQSSSYSILKCNIENIQANTNISFCRFVRESDKFGINLEPGAGNSRYSYHGEGFNNGDCGLLITQPNNFDKSLWKCYIGVQSFNTKASTRNTTLGAILNLSENAQSLVDLQSQNVYGLEYKTLEIICESKTAIEYCWFSHPNGLAISVSDNNIVDGEVDNEKYRYYGNGFHLGHCGIEIANASLSDSGTWKCHVGVYKRSEFEISTEIEVRVTKSNLVTRQQNIEAEVGENVMIECRSIPLNTPLEYCRFYLPNGVGFSIDEEITSSIALQNRYFFNPSHSLKTGYCSIIVTDIDIEHSGRWLCAGKLLGWTSESMDDINISIVGDDLGVAAIIGISVGAVALVILTGAIVIYRRHRKVIHTEDGTEL